MGVKDGKEVPGPRDMNPCRFLSVGTDRYPRCRHVDWLVSSFYKSFFLFLLLCSFSLCVKFYVTLLIKVS